MTFVGLTSDGPESARGCSGWPRLSDSSMLVPLLPGTCETLKNMEVNSVMHDFGFDIAWGIWPNVTVVTSKGLVRGLHGCITILAWV